MALTVHTAEGGTAATDVTIANSGGASGTAWSDVTPGAGGTIQYTTDAFYKGKLAVALTAASGVQCHVSRSIAGARSGACSVYIKFAAFPNAGTLFLVARNSGGSTVCGLGMNTTGNIFSSSAAGVSSTATSTAVTVGVWYRLDWAWTNPTTTTGTSTYALYLADNGTAVSGLSANDTAMNNGTSNATIFRLGKQSTTGTFGTITIDDVQYNDGTTTPPGASSLTSPDDYYIAQRGSLSNTSAGTTSVVDLADGAAITTGNYLFAYAAVDNSGTNGAAPGLTVTDSSNTWTTLTAALQDPGAASEGTTCYIAYCEVNTSYANGADVTFTWGTSATAKAISIVELSNVHGTSPIAVAATQNNGTSAAASTTTISPTDVDELVFAAVATEGPAGDVFTLDTDTTDGEWFALPSVSTDTATAASNQTVHAAVKRVTGTSAQVFNSTITSRDWAAVAVSIAPTPPPVVPTQLATPTGFTFAKQDDLRQIDAAWASVENADAYRLEVEILDVGGNPLDEGDWNAFGTFETQTLGQSVDDGDGVDWERTYRGRVTALAP